MPLLWGIWGRFSFSIRLKPHRACKKYDFDKVVKRLMERRSFRSASGQELFDFKNLKLKSVSFFTHDSIEYLDCKSMFNCIEPHY